MPLKQHPRADELEAYILDRVPPPTAIRMARHVLSCPQCIDRAALIEARAERRPNSAPPGVLLRLSESLRRAWYEPASGLACGFAAVALISLAFSLFQPQTGPADAASVGSGKPVYGPGPELAQPELEPLAPVLQAVVEAKHRTPPRRAVRRFSAPDESRRAYAVGYLLPPPRPLPVPSATLRFASLNTAIAAPAPSPRPMKTKRHPLIRFFGVIAKPFRS